MRRCKLTLFFIAAALSTQAQDFLSLDEAIRLGLEKNYAVVIQRTQLDIAKAQNNFGAAGMSPTVSLNAALNASVLDSKQEFNTGATQDRQGARSNALAASVNANWIVFDGLRMFAVKKRLELSEGASALQLRQQMENSIYDIISVYYNIVRIRGLIKAAQQNLAIYAERKKVAQLKSEIGSDSRVDFLLSQSDENQARGDILRLELDLLTAKTNLNTLLARPVDADFRTADTIVVNYDPAFEELKRSSVERNASIMLARQNERIMDQAVREARAANLPFLQLVGAYNFTRNQSQAGIVFLNRQAGFAGGITASWLIFNGNRNSRLVRERSLQVLTQKYLTEQTQLLVDAAVLVNFKAFQMNKALADLELQNLRDAQEVQLVSLERYKIGKSSLLETIETQKNLEDAQVRFLNALYAVKLAEADLLRANGNLIK